VSIKVNEIDVRNAGLLVLAQCIVAWIISPYGNFPLNDDWAYAHSVEWLLTENRIRLSDWIAMTLLPQTLLGGGLSAMLGFSFEVLRALTFGTSLLCSVLLYGWFRQVCAPPARALLYVAAMAATPWWWPLSLSYMTEFYSFLFFIPAAMLALRLLQNSAAPWPTLVAFSVVCALGTVQRQVIVILPAAWLLTHIWQCRTANASAFGAVLLRAATPIALTLGAYIAYVAYLRNGPGLPAAQAMHNGRLWEYLLELLAGDAFRWAVTRIWLLSWLGYFGFALITLSPFWYFGRNHARGTRIALGIVACTYGATIAWMGGSLPFRENNVIDALGTGPFTLFDGLHLHPFNALVRPKGGVWFWVTMVASVGVAMFVYALLKALANAKDARQNEHAVSLFLTIALCGYSFAFVVTDYIDRYIFFVLPLAIALVDRALVADRERGRGLEDAPGAQRVGYFASIASVMIMGTWSIMGAHDYFAWNRTRWDAIAVAEAQGARPETLDAGFEYNGRNRFEVKPRVSVSGKSWWWVKDDEWVVSFAARHGYDVHEQFPVNAWLPTTPRAIYLSRRRP
jgi:hypothetical protein